MTALKSDSAPVRPDAGTDAKNIPAGDATAAEATEKAVRKPYLAADGTLVIPFDADPKYHWWIKGGLSPEKTRGELESAGKQDGTPTGGTPAPTATAQK